MNSPTSSTDTAGRAGPGSALGEPERDQGRAVGGRGAADHRGSGRGGSRAPAAARGRAPCGCVARKFEVPRGRRPRRRARAASGGNISLWARSGGSSGVAGAVSRRDQRAEQQRGPSFAVVVPVRAQPPEDEDRLLEPQAGSTRTRATTSSSPGLHQRCHISGHRELPPPPARAARRRAGTRSGPSGPRSAPRRVVDVLATRHEPTGLDREVDEYPGSPRSPPPIRRRSPSYQPLGRS